MTIRLFTPRFWIAVFTLTSWIILPVSQVRASNNQMYFAEREAPGWSYLQISGGQTCFVHPDVQLEMWSENGTEVIFSTNEYFNDTGWRSMPKDHVVPWTLPNEDGYYTLYYAFRNDAGMTSVETYEFWVDQTDYCGLDLEAIFGGVPTEKDLRLVERNFLLLDLAIYSFREVTYELLSRAMEDEALGSASADTMLEVMTGVMAHMFNLLADEFFAIDIEDPELQEELGLLGDELRLLSQEIEQDGLEAFLEDLTLPSEELMNGEGSARDVLFEEFFGDLLMEDSAEDALYEQLWYLELAYEELLMAMLDVPFETLIELNQSALAQIDPVYAEYRALMLMLHGDQRTVDYYSSVMNSAMKQLMGGDRYAADDLIVGTVIRVDIPLIFEAMVRGVTGEEGTPDTELFNQLFSEEHLFLDIDEDVEMELMM